MPRLFFAIEPPAAVQDELDGFAEGIPRARWALETGYHLTLAFLGDVPEHRLVDAIDVADSIRRPPFQLCLNGAGVFPRRGDPKVLWAGVEQSDALEALQRVLSRELRHAGFNIEKRKFHPHITVARIAKSPPAAVHDWLGGHVAYRSAPFLIRGFELISSTLRPQGSIYHPEASFELGQLS